MKSKFFYDCIIEKKTFQRQTWSPYGQNYLILVIVILYGRKIYNQKVTSMKIAKVSEFNFKLLHNIVPCGNIIHKWQRNISENCLKCNEIETVQHHVVFL